MKKIILTTLILITALLAVAQKNGSIKGMITDSADHKNLVKYATVSVYKLGDSVLTSYKLSDEKGAFQIPGLEPGKYRLVIVAYQFQNFRKEFEINASNAVLDLGTVYLSSSSNLLDEVEIRGERPPIIVRKDTIEFNAESFKTLPTAVVEDLLKKLPGVNLTSDGQIMVNGKAVSKILVDGKEFFGGDQKIATKNLPANIIDKIQVMDDQEAKRRDPDLYGVDVPQVINLKLKKAIKQGAFGKLYGGLGLHDYYETGGIISLFRDTTQISLLAYGNNISKPGFSLGDVQSIGGFQRSGFNMMMMNSEGGFALDNISFGGLGGGLITSSGAGLNFNTLLKGGVKINTRYFLGHSKNYNEVLTNENQSLGNQRLISNTQSISENNAYTHNISTKLEWKIDSLTTFTATPTAFINPIKFNSLSNKNSENELGNAINSAITSTNKHTDALQLGLSLSLWKDFSKKGRALNISTDVSNNSNEDQNFNNSSSIFYLNPGSTQLNQLRNSNTRYFRSYLYANFSEPLSKKLTLNTSFSVNYISNENALATFFKNPFNEAYDLIVPNLSETVSQSGFRTQTRGSLRWKITSDLSLESYLVFNTIDLKNKFLKYDDFDQRYTFLFPSVLIRYKVFSFNYTPSFEEPSITYIQPVSNNTDPLFIQNGNTNLLPAKTHRFTINMYKYNPKTLINYNLYAGGTYKTDGVIMSRIISDQGVQTNTPVNASGMLQFYASGSITKDIKNGKNQVSLSTGFNSNFNRNKVEVNNFRSTYTTFSVAPRAGIRLNFRDKIEFTQSYNIVINKTVYEDSFFIDRKVLSHNSESELVFRYPKNFVLETNFRIQAVEQQIAGFNNNIKLWNAGITYLFLKNSRGQLKFSVNDILQNSVRRYVSLNENYVRDVQNNNIGRYGMLTFTYNIQNFGGKVGGKERFFGF